MDKVQMQGLVADINFRGLDQWSALHFASNNGHLEIIKEIVKDQSVEIDALSQIMRTPLHCACIRGFTMIARELVQNGANPNARDFDESTPLHCASEQGFIETITYLIVEADANPFLKNKFGYIPSDIAMNLETRKAFE